MADGIDEDIQALLNGDPVDSTSKLHVDLPIKGIRFSYNASYR